jgi:hypothetical protein
LETKTERGRKAAAGEGEKKQGRRERETKVEEHTQGHLRSI